MSKYKQKLNLFKLVALGVISSTSFKIVQADNLIALPLVDEWNGLADRAAVLAAVNKEGVIRAANQKNGAEQITTPAETGAEKIAVQGDELARREQEGYDLLLRMIDSPFTKTFREYCEDLIAIWKDIPKFKEFCAELEKLKTAKDPKKLKESLSRFSGLFPKVLQDKLNNMSLKQQLAFRSRLISAMK